MLWGRPRERLPHSRLEYQLQRSDVNESPDPSPDFERLLLLSTEIKAQMEQLDQLSFEEILTLAPALLRTMVSGSSLQVIREHEQAADALVQTGTIQLANGTSAFASTYVGPPEPVWFMVYGFPDTWQLTVALFLQQLQHALQAAGYTEELNRQARQDWLTGLFWAGRLRQTLEEKLPEWTPMALLVTDLSQPADESSEEERQLRLRWFAQALRLSLDEDGSAYKLQRNRLAVLMPERELSRIESTIRRLAPHSRLAYALSGEASGSALLDLALARLGGGGAAQRKNLHTRRTERRTGQYPLSIHCGSPTARALLAQLTGDWRFTSPLSLILDQPAGFALEEFPDVRRPVLILTDGASHGYAHDLMELEPEGLVFGQLSSAELRRHLQVLATGERIFAGPIIDRSPLFPRERQVWRLIAQGLDNPAIARQLGIGERTAANYFTSLKDKLHLPTRSAVALAYWGRLRGGHP